MSTNMGGSATKLLYSWTQCLSYQEIITEDTCKPSEANKGPSEQSKESSEASKGLSEQSKEALEASKATNNASEQPSKGAQASNKTGTVLPVSRLTADSLRSVLVCVSEQPQGKGRGNESAVNGGDSKVLVHPINVGQGDAILLQIQHKNGENEKHLIDGGRGQRTVNTQFYSNLKQTLQANGCHTTTTPSTVELDSIIITHPNIDHYGGINRLLESSTINSPIITTLASSLRVQTEGKSEQRKGEVFVSKETALTRHWFPFTGEGQNGRKHMYIRTLPKGSTSEIVKNDVLKLDAKQLNATSILTTVKLPGSKHDYDVVLTGDSYCDIIRDTLALKGKSVGVFQVPHHGSKYNYSQHSNRAAFEREFETFYTSFNADIYLISHGDHGGYNHPHSEVITGIARAAVVKNRPCKIVVTATWFYESRINEVSVPNWSEYVKIYHFKEAIPYVTLDPSNSTMPEGLQLYTKKVQVSKRKESVPTPPPPVATSPSVNIEAKEHTPIRSRVPVEPLTQEYGAVRRMLFPTDSDKKEKTSPPKKVCIHCKQTVSPTEYSYSCKNDKCPIKIHANCETEARKADRFIRNYQKCRYCRTCKECNTVMGTVHASCDLCGGAGHVPCIRATPGQSRDVYNCRVCREKTEQPAQVSKSKVSSPVAATPLTVNVDAKERSPIKSRVEPLTQEYGAVRRMLFPTDNDKKEKASPPKKVCIHCKQTVTPTEYLYSCKNDKCPIKIHANCETEARKADRFTRNYKKCRYCRTCKECNTVMGTVHASCDLCGGAGHVPCIRTTPGQSRDVYNCRVCREQSIK